MVYSVQREGGKADDEIQDMVFEFPGAWREVAMGTDMVDVGEVDIGFRYRYYRFPSFLQPVGAKTQRGVFSPTSDTDTMLHGAIEIH